MRSFWSDPYLWVHLAGLAAVPIFLELCLVGFAIGDPFLPSWVELLLVAALGIAPILWMQWQRPFYIFSLVAVALQPKQLTEDQLRLLRLFKAERNRVIAAIVPVVLVVLLAQVYRVSPLALSAVALPTGWRFLGLLLAAIGFLGCNLFTQVPASVASVMLHSDLFFSTTNPYPLDQVHQNFTRLGVPVRSILPALLVEPEPIVAAPGVATGVAMVSPAAAVEAAVETAVTPDLPAPEVLGTEEPDPVAPLVELTDAPRQDDVWGD